MRDPELSDDNYEVEAVQAVQLKEPVAQGRPQELCDDWQQKERRKKEAERLKRHRKRKKQVWLNNTRQDCIHLGECREYDAVDCHDCDEYERTH